MVRGSESQFHYWDLRRRGVPQSEISKDHNVSRQAVSKAIMAEERAVEIRLLQHAESSGILVEWYDKSKGILIGIIPPLGDIICIMLIDRTDRIRIHYDPEALKGRSGREKAFNILKGDLHAIYGRVFVDCSQTRTLISKITQQGDERDGGKS
jgi:hypothetical protein